MRQRKVFSMSTVRVCIDECRNGIRGRAYSKLRAAPLIFSGLGEMILWMDRIFNEYGYPQAFQECRSFRKQRGRASSWTMPPPRLADEEMERQRGTFYTFDIVVQSRRQSGWQGILMTPDRSVAASFGSEMELLTILCREMERGWEPLTGEKENETGQQTEPFVAYRDKQ